MGKWTLAHRVFVEGVHRCAAGRPVDLRHSVHQYPATTILVPAGALAAAGLSDDRALRLTMSFLISLVAALLAIPILALVSFLFFDPYLVFSPIEQVSYIIKMIFFHALYPGTTNEIDSIVYSSLFGVVSLVLAGILLSSRRLQSLPPDLALLLMAVSMVMTLVLFAGRHHPPWLFYPAYLVWELLLPLIVMDGIRALPGRGYENSVMVPDSTALSLVPAAFFRHGI
jgi:hypothetical protein